MAYDPNAAYIPPRRAYYEPPPHLAQQQQQQASYGHGYNAPSQGYGNGYDQSYGQDYSQGYGQDYGQGYSQGQIYQGNGQWTGGQQDMRQQQQQQPQSVSRPQRYDYDDQGRSRAQKQPQQQPQQQQNRRREERNYNPRYQQRAGKSSRPQQNGYEQQQQQQQQPERGRQPGYKNYPPSDPRGREQRSDQRRPDAGYEAQPRPQQQMPQQQLAMHTQQPDSRPNPRNGRTYPGESQPQSNPASYQTQPQSRLPPHSAGYNQQTFDLPPPPRIRDNERPQSAPGIGRRAESPGKLTMDEWKAAERARMHAASAMPDTVAWDNAFPVFPTKRDRSKARSGTSSARASSDLPRPGTSSSNRHDRPSSRSRTYSDSASALQARQLLQQQSQQQQARPPLDRNARSYNQVAELPVQSNSPKAPMKLPLAHNTLMRNNTGSPERYDGYAGQLSQQNPPQHTPPVTTTLPHPYERAPASLQPDHGSSYLDHQPLSPPPLQPRPSTAHGQKSPPTQSMVGPPVISQSEIVSSGNQSHVQQPLQSWNRQQEGQLASSSQSVVRTATPPRSRDQEIEDSMPDFDSAAPGGTSLLHKRSVQHINGQAAGIPPPVPAVIPIQVDSTPIPVSPQDQRSYPQPSYQLQPAVKNQGRESENRDPHVNGHIYGQPGQSNGRKIGASYGSPPPPPPPPEQQYQPPQQYQQQYQQPLPQQYQQPPPQNAQPMSQLEYPPRAPFADDRPRRSLDDSRQVPYNQAPLSQQRPPTSGPHQPRQPYPPQSQSRGGRNGVDLSVQTSWSNPARQDTINSAPPTQQNFRDYRPRQPNGGSMARQGSAPDEPPAKSPDALPHHPVPFRPGHAQPPKPEPVRNHGVAPSSSHKRRPSSSNSKPTRPVTASELQQLQAAVNANPGDNKRAMLLVKKFVEASTVLASEGGRADRQTTSRNRDRYIKDADKLLRRLAAANYPEAQFYLADCYGSGTLNLDPNPREAFKLYQAAAKVGHAQAAYRTAMCCELGPEDGGTTKDFGKAAQWYRRGAALGDTDSMFKIGIILLKGLLGQPRNVSEAIAYLRRSIEQSAGEPNPQALYEIAQLHESTLRNPEVRNQVPADDAKAFELFNQAAATGHKASQFRLGQAYEYGQMGTAIDNRASITWYTKAAAQGEHQAELALSGWYLTGAEGILQQSDQEAYLWARKAAASEPPLGKAMFAMGYFTETGIGCPKNLDEAKKWYARAAAYKFPKAHERLEELRRNGSKNSRPVNGRLGRKDQKRDEENCVVM